MTALDLLPIIVFLLFAYLLGAVPFGFLLGKLKGMDIRQYGSGNIGATNLTRLAGREWGVLCFALDFGKGAGAVLAAILLFDKGTGHSLIPVLAAAAAVAGHVWPVWLGFKGGKGVATALGAILILAPWAFVGAGVVWIIVFCLTRYVSLASIVAAVVLPLSYFVTARWLMEPGGAEPVPAGLLTALALFIIWRHRENIQRLASGKEHRFNRDKKVKSCE